MLILLFIASLSIRILILLAPRSLVWDGTIYVAMGKYIFSHGTVGYWEPFRPVIWPAILGFLWKLGFDSYTLGIYIQILASLIALYFTYKIGEKVARGSGLYAATLLSFTPIFMAFIIAPLTDLPSVAIALGALYFFLEEYFFTAGILVAVAFLFRFPQILIGLPLGFMTLVYLVRDKRKRPIARFLLGVVPILCAFFIFNSIAYHDPLYPIHTGTIVTATSTGPHDHETFFYSINTFIENPFLLFLITAIVLWLWNFKSTLRNNARILVMLNALVVGLYFGFFPHKELRYSIAFLPYLALMAAFGIHYFFGTIKSKYTRPIITLFLIVSLLLISLQALNNNIPEGPTKELQAYLGFFHSLPGAKVISSSPQLLAHNDIHATSISDTWEDMYDNYEDDTIAREYVALDTCQLSCATTAEKCATAKYDLLTELGERETLMLSKNTAGSCSLLIYKTSQ